MDPFKNHLKQFIVISDEEYDSILSFFDEVEYKKKENLLEEGQICRSNFFVLQGCLRKFFYKANGTEQTIQFALENWWMSDLFNFERQQVADCYIQAVEKTKVLKLDYHHFKQLLYKHPVMEQYFRIIYQKSSAAAERRIRYVYEYSKEDAYHHFNSLFPDFIQRIPQYLIASYLGFTPEYLSEIRAKIRS